MENNLEKKNCSKWGEDVKTSTNFFTPSVKPPLLLHPCSYSAGSSSLKKSHLFLPQSQTLTLSSPKSTALGSINRALGPLSWPPAAAGPRTQRGGGNPLPPFHLPMAIRLGFYDENPCLRWQVL